MTGAYIAPSLKVRWYLKSVPETSFEPVIALPFTMMSPRGVANCVILTRRLCSWVASSSLLANCSQLVRSSRASMSSPQKMAMCRNGLFIVLLIPGSRAHTHTGRTIDVRR